MYLSGPKGKQPCRRPWSPESSETPPLAVPTAGGGVIVNTASTVALVGLERRAAYCASKGGAAALTRAMALDHVRDRIRVNCVAPGTIETPYFAEMFAKSPDPQALRKELEGRQAMGRLGRPEEVAYAMLYLACEKSSFVTGSVLVVDGGWTAR